MWTLLIFILCFLPGKDIPDIRVPFIDKWVHFILFGAFAVLWLCAYPTRKITGLLLMLAVSVFLGWLVEVLQGQLSSLGRTQDNMDTLADSIGGLLGILLFALLAYRAVRKGQAAD